MTKRFLATAAFLLSSTVLVSATEIGATFETACPFGDCAAGISLSQPEGFAPTPDKSTGIRDNRAFEDLAAAPSDDVFVGVEAALYQDGPKPSLTTGSLSRIIRCDGAIGEPKAQYVYPVSPIPQAATKPDGGNDNGMSEILALDHHRLLAVERSYAEGFGNNIKIMMIDLADATDISAIASLAKNDQRVVPARKSQVLDLLAIGLAPDNIEAMSLGKAKDGADVLILGSDNNFSASQKTQFYAFKLLSRPQQ
ncbi:esterase-like activity of phytase family protein [Rhizobium lentis]|uniref:esterase-like activity of phytase family protein n=1 Tax=Rhizobium lentis TaxID=1138194 RepID=UPI001C83BBCF|nr:esterase-like activity of phytase family protein [Rhizobium lentis]MBX4972122.1 esterase-like activity of phytase family protein [Rhizobium lentis]